MNAGDLVVFSVAGVQPFILESRSTADLHSGSALVAHLARAAVTVARGRPDTVPIMPGGDAVAGTPNRVVVLTASGQGPELGRAMARAVTALWESYLGETFAGTEHPVRETSGFPVVRWVSVAVGSGGYREQWARALEALTARKRVREFPGVAVTQARICALTARWPAVEDRRRPAGFGPRAGERLSPVGHVKRWYARTHGERFASTWSVASAPFRAAVIEAAARNRELRDEAEFLRETVEALCADHHGRERAALRRRGGDLPGVPRSDDEVLAWLRRVEGAWCAPETWEPGGLQRDHDLAAAPDTDLCALGAEAAADLSRAAKKAGAGSADPLPGDRRPGRRPHGQAPRFLPNRRGRAVGLASAGFRRHRQSWGGSGGGDPRRVSGSGRVRGWR
nr:type III-B CRISPR-associated protein Cas10/Cmr2 [Actinomadura pelletieri]